MISLSAFIAWLFTGTNGFLFTSGAVAFMFIVMVAVFLINAIRKVDLTQMFYETGSKEVSSSKFWHVVACFVATIAFLFINITAPGSASLEFIWLTYLAVIAGSASVNNLISARFNAQVEQAKAQVAQAQQAMPMNMPMGMSMGMQEPSPTPAYADYPMGQPVRS